MKMGFKIGPFLHFHQNYYRVFFARSKTLRDIACSSNESKENSKVHFIIKIIFRSSLSHVHIFIYVAGLVELERKGTPVYVFPKNKYYITVVEIVVKIIYSVSKGKLYKDEGSLICST